MGLIRFSCVTGASRMTFLVYPLCDQSFRWDVFKVIKDNIKLFILVWKFV